MFEIGEAEIKLSRIFTDVTGYMPTLSLDLGEVAAFLVHKDALGRVIGKEGKNIKLLSKKLDKQVYVFADSDDLEEFIRNLFNNVSILAIDVVDIMGEKTVTLVVSEKDKAKALGRGKARLKVAKELLRQKFGASLSLRTKVMV